MSGNLATKKVKSIALSDYIPQPKAILKGARGPWPLTQSKVLEMFLSREGEPIFRIQWFEVKNTDQITLSNNLVEKLPANKIHENQNCRYLINAGFYTPDDKPIGYFYTDGQVLRSEITSSTFNGFFSVNDFATPRITNVLPRDHLRFALQSGPILIENSFPQKISISNDKPARRSIVATTGENRAVFIVIYDPESQFNGPLLANLPEVLEAFQSEVDIPLADALNLDGGTASAFYTPETSLSELSPIGSYFCIR